MTPQMQKIVSTASTGASGVMLTSVAWVVDHLTGAITTVTAFAGMVLTVVSAINAIGTWRDRRAENRREAAQQTIERPLIYMPTAEEIARQKYPPNH